MTKALEKTTAPLAAVPAFSREQIELLKRTTCKGATDDELQLFLALCRRTGLDPFARQIYAIKRWDSREKREVLQTQTSIDGLRLIADRSGKYEGQEGPYWCGADGNWRDVWLSDEPPVAAKVGVLKQNCRAPFWGVARYQEYCQTDRSGSPNGMWRNMPANQLAKCCEALALRKAFPQELSGLYGSDELDHTENGAEQVRISEPPPSSSKPWTSFRGMIDEFAKLHTRLGQENDHVYRETLRKHGAEHSNQFKDPAKAVAAYAELLATVQTLEAQTDADDPPEAV
jgi:phage recombination protein Bet